MSSDKMKSAIALQLTLSTFVRNCTRKSVGLWNLAAPTANRERRRICVIRRQFTTKVKSRRICTPVRSIYKIKFKCVEVERSVELHVNYSSNVYMRCVKAESKTRSALKRCSVFSLMEWKKKCTYTECEWTLCVTVTGARCTLVRSIIMRKLLMYSTDRAAYIRIALCGAH